MRILYTSVEPPPVYPDGTCQPPVATAWPEARLALIRHAPQAERVVIDHADWRGYWRAVSCRWGGDDLMLVEQDIRLHSRAVPELEACPEPWCLFPYHHPGAGGLLAEGLGCTRFRREFQEAVPLSALAQIYGSCPRCAGADDAYKCWAHLDGRLLQAATDRGFTPHVHSPAVGHRDVPPEGEQ